MRCVGFRLFLYKQHVFFTDATVFWYAVPEANDSIRALTKWFLLSEGKPTVRKSHFEPLRLS